MTGNHMTPRKFLATEVQAIREKLEMNTLEFGRVLHVGESTVRAWEKGRRIPHPDDLDRIEVLHKPDGVLRRFRERLINAASIVEWFGAWPTIESQATALMNHQLSVIPGLLQTPEYAREIFLEADLSGDIDQMVTDRIERQQIMEDEDAPTLVALLSENVLDNNVGGPEVMCAQLTRLVEVATTKRGIIMHVIPNRSRACAGYRGPFVLAEYTDDKGEDRTAAYVDNAVNGEVTDDRDTIVRLRRVFDTLRARALNHDDSVSLISRKAQEWTA